MTDAHEFIIWRAEIEAEHTEALRELAEAKEALAAAQTARDTARAALLVLRAKLAPFAAPLPRTLAQRAQDAAQAAHQTEGALSLARQYVANARVSAERLAGDLEVATRFAGPIEAEEVAE